MQSLLDDQMKQKLYGQERARQASNLENSKRPSTRRLFGLFQRWSPPIAHNDIQTCHQETNDEESHGCFESQIDSVGLCVCRNVHQKSTRWKQMLVNDSKAPSTAVANKANTKGIFAKITVSHCVRQRLSFEDNSVVKVGYSGNRKKCKSFSEHTKLKTPRRLQNSYRCEEFPLNCNGKIVSGVHFLLFLILMFPIFIHISLFIFFFNCLLNNNYTLHCK
jgi:hypothetical protein